MAVSTVAPGSVDARREPPLLARVPPPVVPLGFLAAAGAGMIAFGIALAFVASDVVNAPTSPPVVATVHLAMLAFLSAAVLGAIHQFTPVVGGRPLRSERAARLSLVAFPAAAWLLPLGFAIDSAPLVSTAGVLAVASIGLVAWNVSRPLASPERTPPIIGLRWSVSFLVVTALMGGIYAFDRQAGWFPLLPHRVLAHAHLGLLGWLGLTYVAVAEKLWPMFLLAHRPEARAGSWAVRLVPAGVLLLVPGLLFGVPALAIPGGAIVALGLAAHLGSLAGYLRARRRPLALLHAFVLASAALLVTAGVLAAIAGFAPVEPATRARLVTAEIAAAVGWLAVAIVGHAHKIVPFISWTALRARGLDRDASGARTVLFADLYDARVARLTWLIAVAGSVALVVGVLLETPMLVSSAGILMAATGATALANLGLGPMRASRALTKGADLASRCHRREGNAA